MYFHSAITKESTKDFNCEDEPLEEAASCNVWNLNFIFIDVFSGLTAPPSTVVTVRIGTEAVLPCHLGQGVNSSTLRMECVRSDLSPGFVFVWVEGRERLEHKLWSYLQRTSVLFSGMKLGYVFLQLTNVTALDEGTYICRAPRLRQRCSVQLLTCKNKFISGFRFLFSVVQSVPRVLKKSIR